VEQIFESKIMYPRSNTFQKPSNEPESYIQPYHTSSKMKNENIHVKTVPLPVKQMITESRLSQIETINLSSISPKSEQSSEIDTNSIISSEQLSEVDTTSITSLDTVQTEFIYIMKNKIKTTNISDIFEVPVEKPRKVNVKHKKSSGIHVTITKSSKPKQ